MKKSLLFAFALLLFAAGIFSCQKQSGVDTPEPSTGPDRKALLTEWADNLIKPGYQRFNDKLVVLKAKATAFTATPTTATLVEARQAWQAAYVEWQQVELYEFGPAEAVSLRNHFNIYPADAVASYNEMQKAVRLLKVDMTSALGITVTYVDNDGD